MTLEEDLLAPGHLPTTVMGYYEFCGTESSSMLGSV